jgi:uncharacterized protein
MACLRERLESRLRHLVGRLPPLPFLLSGRFAAREQPGPVRFGARSNRCQWLALALLSIVLIAILEALRLPGGIMIGAMLAAIAVATADGSIRMPTRPVVAVQGVIGFMIASTIPPTILSDLARDWSLVLIGLVGVVLGATGIGLALMRWSLLPGATGVWGMAPGASTPMILMAEENGADARLVAVMHKVRTLIVVALAAIVASLGARHAVTSGAVVKAGWFPPVAWGWLLVTLALAVSTAFFANWLRVFTGPMLVTFGLAVVLQGLGWIRIELPPWLLAVAYAFVGWAVGLGFTRPIVWYALRSLPLIVVSSVALIVLCGMLGAVMVIVGGIDPLTAYLATSPGGADSIAIIAASTTVDMRFVMAMQITRLVVVMLIAPALSRWVVRVVGSAPRRKG